MVKNANLTAYIEAFEQLSPETLPQLAERFSESVLFKDPFNCVTGKSATLAIFEHMFATTQSPQFIVIDAAMDGDIALLYWKFYFVLPSSQKQQCIEGMSRVQFNEEGLVTEHIDHWDAGEQVYGKIPLLNWLIKLVRKRLSARH
ncbi:hypothetical protein THMIRHAM_21470 [Thiomicrorhabdus immobilis]|uniref:SnoaL-like domain-containing protein n=1 Tax=Thiomicrorhabdus immobilis TaxID=2791037 RepID=A0ABN6D2L2_9GAMM|nr:nuclear transport factor 2 family protein [Thiomicrorhabdus immobilis]BCN94362.1 hypothetical protein THMIRHAM_21470 [Thiomicrorhabdus immobilis]